MSTGFIELNDASINQAIDGRLIDTSPGYAVLDGEKMLLGQAGQQNARLLPRWTNNRFWNQLNSDPIANSTRSIRHHADLAFGHLEEIWARMISHLDQNENQSIDHVVLAVPGFYDRQQLGLLLGMAKESQIPVSSLVDLGLISVAKQSNLPTTLYLDISLHRISLTHLTSNGLLRAVKTLIISDSGLHTLWDRWANIVAKQFIQTSRYDPMHQADSEQRLFDLLPSWIRKGDKSGPFEIDLHGVKHSTQVSNEQLLTACSTFYPDIVKAIRTTMLSNDGATLFLSHRFLGFPGLVRSLQLIPNLEVEQLNETAAIDAAYANWDKLVSSNGSVSHVTTLPVSGKKTIARFVHQSPTHLLLGNRAYAIKGSLRIESFNNSDSETGDLKESAENARCTLYKRGKDIFLEAHSAEVQINGTSVTGQTSLSPGDRITIENQSAVLITAN
ncbi:MAG: hypothetical protein ABGY96_30540 [bacterium]|nr:hypothetical protein [Gammaproteobacteria bacterium]HIL96508.1 hypothetical protein [Pseudomonadales bacterium]